MNIRLKFSRKGPVKYLGHLDMMRYFQKALLRAEVDMKYSEGFNPHQILSFAYPLGVSMETLGDYMDIEVLDGKNDNYVNKIIADLNSVMNEGIKIVSGSVVPENELNAMASVQAARYEVVVDKELNQDTIDDFLGQQTILIRKEAKESKKDSKNKKADKGPVFKDIKEGIYEMISVPGDDCKLSLFLQSGSSLNIKPVDVINAYSAFCGNQISIKSIVRIDIYRRNGDVLVPLGEF